VPICSKHNAPTSEAGVAARVSSWSGCRGTAWDARSLAGRWRSLAGPGVRRAARRVAKLTALSEALWCIRTMTNYAHLRRRSVMGALALAAALAIAVGGLAPVANAAPKTSNGGGTSPQN